MESKVNNLEDLQPYISKIYKDGYNKGLPTGIEWLDQHYTYRKGELDTVTGFANIGKTTAIFYIMMLASVRYDWKWVCYCPENEPVGEMVIELAEMFIGMTADKTKSERMPKDVFDAACEWVINHFKVISFPRTPSAYDVMDAFQEEINKGGIDGCYLDPMNDLAVDSKVSKYDYYYSVLSDIRRFKQSNNVKFILVTHAVTKAARQKDDEGKTPAPSHYDVEFGGMFANRTDNFLVIHRNPSSEDWDETQIHVRKIKFQKLVGVPTMEDEPVILKYKPKSCRFNALDRKNMVWTDPLQENSQDFITNNRKEQSPTTLMEAFDFNDAIEVDEESNKGFKSSEDIINEIEFGSQESLEDDDEENYPF